MVDAGLRRPRAAVAGPRARAGVVLVQGENERKQLQGSAVSQGCVGVDLGDLAAGRVAEAGARGRAPGPRGPRRNRPGPVAPWGLRRAPTLVLGEGAAGSAAPLGANSQWPAVAVAGDLGSPTVPPSPKAGSSSLAGTAPAAPWPGRAATGAGGDRTSSWATRAPPSVGRRWLRDARRRGPAPRAPPDAVAAAALAATPRPGRRRSSRRAGRPRGRRAPGGLIFGPPASRARTPPPLRARRSGRAPTSCASTARLGRGSNRPAADRGPGASPPGGIIEAENAIGAGHAGFRSGRRHQAAQARARGLGPGHPPRRPSLPDFARGGLGGGRGRAERGVMLCGSGGRRGRRQQVRGPRRVCHDTFSGAGRRGRRRQRPLPGRPRRQGLPRPRVLDTWARPPRRRPAPPGQSHRPRGSMPPSLDARLRPQGPADGRRRRLTGNKLYPSWTGPGSSSSSRASTPRTGWASPGWPKTASRPGSSAAAVRPGWPRAPGCSRCPTSSRAPSRSRRPGSASCAKRAPPTPKPRSWATTCPTCLSCAGPASGWP